MNTIDILRNALLDSNAFERVQYCGRYQLFLVKENRQYVIRMNALDVKYIIENMLRFKKLNPLTEQERSAFIFVVQKIQTGKWR